MLAWFLSKNGFKKWQCHARMMERLSYLHIPKTTSMFHMYEATLEYNILKQVLQPENA